MTSLSLDSFWVEVPEPEYTLPYFWNFKLKPIGLILFHDNRPFPARDSSASKLDLLAMAWFFVLLRNAEQGMEKILNQINDLFVDASPIPNEEFLSLLERSSLPGFEPQHIFWYPQEKNVPEDSKALWYSCLQLGWKMVEALFDTAERSRDMGVWAEHIETLKENVRNALFSPGPPEAATAPQVEAKEEEKKASDLDREIARVLTSIAAKWEAEMVESLASPTSGAPETERPAPAPEFEAEEDLPSLEQTIIVAPKESESPLSERSDIMSQEPEVPETAEEEEIPETIIFSASGQPSSPVSGEAAPAPPRPEVPEEPPKPTQDKEFEKTLSMLDQELMGLVDDAPEAGEPEPVLSPDTTEGGEEDEEIPETVIIKPDDK